jgi:hypothetical protein
MSEPTAKTAEERIAELERRLAALEKYLAQVRSHGLLPNMRPDQ